MMTSYDITMRTIIEIPKEVVDELDKIGTNENRSRASLIRDAIDGYLETKADRKDNTTGFGIWKHRKVDGLAFQQELRNEWSEQ